jgi:hypothetical protein
MHSGWCICCYFIEHRLILEVVPTNLTAPVIELVIFYFFHKFLFVYQRAFVSSSILCGVTEKGEKHQTPQTPHEHTTVDQTRLF